VISTTTRCFSYPAGVAHTHELQTWPDAGHRLLRDLARSGAAYALVVGPPEHVDSLVGRLSADLGVDAVMLGRALAGWESPPSAADVDDALGDATILGDLEILMWPTLDIPILTYLRRRARTHPTIAVWPGEVDNGYARFSRPGRPDYFEGRLDDVTVLRPAAASFPDEVPFIIDRSPE
jgi:hypothetical protein